MSLFFFGNNFYKNKEAFKIFSRQILKVYRILLVETTLESIMFYYNFSATHFSNRTEHLNTSGIASNETDSFCVKPITLAILFPRSQPAWPFSEGVPEDRVCGKNPQTKEDIIRREIRWISQEMVNRVVDNFNVRIAAVLLYSSVGAWSVHSSNYWKSIVKNY